MNEGWKCPSCQTVYAPFVRECKCSKRKKNVYAVTVSTTVERDDIKLELWNYDMIVHVEAERQYYKLNTHDKWTAYTPGKQVVILNIKKDK